MAGLFKKKNDAEENAGGNVSKQDVFSKQENANRGIGSRLKELFSGTKGKRLARGTNMTVLVAAVVAIAVILNLLLELVPLNIDLTTEKLYTLTEVTEKVLDELKNDVTVYALYDRLAGETDSNANTAQIIKVLDLYEKSSRINVEYVDLDRNPSFLKETVGESNAANYSEGDYIVKCGDNIRRIDGDDMYETTTQQYYFWTQKVTTGLQAETKLTSSIIKVTSAVPVIYYSSGFGETSMNRYSTLVSYIENSGFDFQSIDLKTENLPDDAVAIMFFGPTEDLTGEAEDKLDRWLMKGGNAFFFMDVKSVEDNSYIYNSFDNFGMIFNKYGITLGDSVVSETGDNKYEASSDVIFRTDTVTAGALEKLKNTEMYILNTRNIDVDPMADLAEAEAFLVTSDSAEAKSINDGKTLTGKQIVGASGKYSGGMKTSRIIVFGSSHSFTDATLQFFGTAAETVMRYSMDWMNMESSSNVGDSIEAKRYNNRITSAVIVTESHQTVIAVAVMIVIPLIILIVGLVIWLRRRHL